MLNIIYGCVLTDKYYIRAYWSKLPISLFPIIAVAEKELTPDGPSCIEIRADLVSVHGPGLTGGRALEPSDFVVDGHEAGPGKRFLVNYCNCFELRISWVDFLTTTLFRDEIS